MTDPNVTLALKDAQVIPPFSTEEIDDRYDRYDTDDTDDTDDDWNGWKWQEMTGIAGNGWQGLE